MNENTTLKDIFERIPANKAEPKAKSYREDGGSFETNQTRPSTQYPRPSSNTREIARKEDRSGMSVSAWLLVFKVVDLVSDVIKGIMVVGGILAANLADFIMGSIAVSFLVRPQISTYTFVNGFGFGAILSMGSSAIQIYMWSLIQKRKIKLKDLLKWKTLPEDVKGFMAAAIILWFIDTFLDMSPLFVLLSNTMYTEFQYVYIALVVFVAIILFILCGFAEILTSNMKSMFRME